MHKIVRMTQAEALATQMSWNQFDCHCGRLDWPHSLHKARNMRISTIWVVRAQCYSGPLFANGHGVSQPVAANLHPSDNESSVYLWYVPATYSLLMTVVVALGPLKACCVATNHKCSINASPVSSDGPDVEFRS